ncbi:MAG: hypothetical protein ABW001_07100 [Mycobacterium sp.]
MHPVEHEPVVVQQHEERAAAVARHLAVDDHRIVDTCRPVAEAAVGATLGCLETRNGVLRHGHSAVQLAEHLAKDVAASSAMADQSSSVALRIVVALELGAMAGTRSTLAYPPRERTRFFLGL